MMWDGVKLALWCGVACGLAACGGGGGGGTTGGGGGGSPGDPRLGRLDMYEEQKQQVLGNPAIGVPAMALTPAGQMPAAGTGVFTGSATMRVELPGDPLVLYGDARVTVDFDAAIMGGALDSFFGGTAGGGVADYDGAITLAGGMPAQNAVLGYAGQLRTSTRTLDFDGALDTLFLGQPATAIAASDLEGRVDVNEVAQDVTVIVVGQGAVTIPPAT